jgi:hypothetical protein
MGGRSTSFNIYISHVRNFTLKIKKKYDGFKIAGKLILVFFNFFGLFTRDFLKKTLYYILPLTGT